MSKRWRRSASVSAGPTGFAPVGPVVVSVVALGDGTADVTFDQPVTWDGVPPGTFFIVSAGGQWTIQQAPNVINFQNGGGDVAAGMPWSWTGPDTSLTPVPSSSQTGLVS